MRKKICGRCGKFIGEGTQCSCKRTAFTQSRTTKSKEKDKIHSTEWRAKRLQIIKRDNFMCMRCFIKYKIITTDDLTVHHILSRKHHPELMFEDDNLICLCATCNKQLGTKDNLDFEWDASKYKEINEIVL